MSLGNASRLGGDTGGAKTLLGPTGVSRGVSILSLIVKLTPGSDPGAYILSHQVLPFLSKHLFPFVLGR